MSVSFLTSDPQSGDDVIVEGSFRASLERVYKAWTDPQDMLRWFCPEEGLLANVSVDLRVGGRICFEFKTTDSLRSAIEGSYIAIEELNELSFSWSHVVVSLDGVETRTPESVVTVTFAETEDGTHVHLCHSGIQTDTGICNVSDGWNGTFVRFDRFIAGLSAEPVC